MFSCLHKGVCWLFIEKQLADSDGDCVAVLMCNQFSADGSDEPRKKQYKKRSKASFEKVGGPDVIEECAITEKQFKKARKKIRIAQMNKSLDENVILAVKSLKYVTFKKASPAQKAQIINIAKDL